MPRPYWILLCAGVVIGLIISGRYALHAQERADEPPAVSRPVVRENAVVTPKAAPDRDLPDERQPAPGAIKDRTTAVSLQEALLRPYRFPFAQPTPLAEVCAHLRDTLKGPVVLDLAALDRKSVEPETTVQLALDGVRLKTGLKLLLDQVGLTYQVIAEDNLMIITDQEGSEDPADKIWAELRALHRDLHAVQDAVDDLTDILSGEPGDGARVRKPTIIEEMPDNGGQRPKVGPDKPGRGGEKPDAAGAPAPGSRPLPARVPLAGPRRSL
jgi:hypothetical protein